MKSVLISIKPEWCEKIISGEKTVEIRKTAPGDRPFLAYIYCTTQGKILNIPISDERLRADLAVHGMMSMNCPIGNGKVIGEFKCERVGELSGRGIVTEESLRNACLTVDQFNKYRKGQKTYFWHISCLKVYDEPRPLTNYHRPCPEGLYCESCAMHNEHPVPFCGNYALEIRRPPQSWMYAEDQT